MRNQSIIFPLLLREKLKTHGAFPRSISILSTTCFDPTSFHLSPVLQRRRRRLKKKKETKRESERERDNIRQSKLWDAVQIFITEYVCERWILADELTDLLSKTDSGHATFSGRVCCELSSFPLSFLSPSCFHISQPALEREYITQRKKKKKNP